jgi:hypothetical protein
MKTLTFLIALVVFQTTAMAHLRIDNKSIEASNNKYANEISFFEPWQMISSWHNHDFEIAVFPNPTSEFLKIQIHGFVPYRLKFKVYNLFGQIALRGYIISGAALLDFSNLDYGTYMLHIFDVDNRIIHSKQVLKEY